MPTLIDANGVTREVTQDQYDRMASNEGANFQTLHEEGIDRVYLWDNIDGTRSGPFERQFAYKVYLRKEVLKCSVCQFTTSFNSGMQKHVNSVLEQAANHRGDVVIDGIYDGRPVKTCIGCKRGATFQSLPEALAHVRAFTSIGPSHTNGVKWHAIKRFSLERPEVPAGDHVSVPVNGNGVAPLERSKRRRHRSRQRGRVRSA